MPCCIHLSVAKFSILLQVLNHFTDEYDKETEEEHLSRLGSELRAVANIGPPLQPQRIEGVRDPLRPLARRCNETRGLADRPTCCCYFMRHNLLLLFHVAQLRSFHTPTAPLARFDP